MKLTILIFLSGILSINFNARAEANGEEIKGKVTSVIDGNTIEITVSDKEKYIILLHGIDSPDPGQNFADVAKLLVEKLLLNKNVTIAIHGKDRTGNRLGDIRVEGLADPKRELIRQGLAWTTDVDPSGELESLKEHAKAQGLGLWSEENPMPPWMYRRQQSMARAKSS